MKKYTDYIIDKRNRKIIGDFDKAYSMCEDIWPNQFVDYFPKHSVLKSIIDNIGANCKILDVGCGFGFLVSQFKKQGFRVFGCDISETAIKRGNEMYGDDLNISYGDITNKLPFKNNFFDVVYCFGVFQYILSKVDYALTELRRKVKNNGYVLISISLPENPIGKEWVEDYESFLCHFSKFFTIHGTAINYSVKANSKTIINPENSDLFVWGKPIIKT